MESLRKVGWPTLRKFTQTLILRKSPFSCCVFFSGRSQCHKLDRSWWELQDRTWKGCRTGCRTKRCPLALSVGQVGCVKMTDFSTKILLCLAVISIFVVFCRINNLFHKWTTQQWIIQYGLLIAKVSAIFKIWKFAAQCLIFVGTRSQ